MSIDDRIRNARVMAQLTQQQLADELEVTRLTIVKYECGVSKPESDKLKKICEILNISIEELFQ